MSVLRGLSHGRRFSDRARGHGAHGGPVPRRRTRALADARRSGEDEVADAGDVRESHRKIMGNHGKMMEDDGRSRRNHGSMMI